MIILQNQNFAGSKKSKFSKNYFAKFREAKKGL